MIKAHSLLVAALVAGAALVLTARPAHAYIDPGTGSMLLQALMAGLLAVGVFGRRIYGYFSTLFRRGGRAGESGDDAPDAGDRGDRT